MLTIKQVKYYKLPKYPRDTYYEHPMTFSIRKGGFASAALLALLLSSCKPPAVTDVPTPDDRPAGKPPVQIPFATPGLTAPPREMITEREIARAGTETITEEMARDAFFKAFARNGITLQSDVPFTFPVSGNAVNLVLDGFDTNLKVGFEYISQNDTGSFSPVVENALDKAGESKEKGAKILTIEAFGYGGASPYFALQLIEENVDKFIYNLRLNGLI